MATKDDRTINTVLLIGGGLLIVDHIADSIFPGRTTPGTDDITAEGQEDTEEPTLTADTLNVLAQSCEQALLGGWGEDEETLYSVFRQMGNRADVFALIRTYGTRCQFFGMINCATLPQAMGYFLNRSELDNINGILASAGIELSF